MQQKCIEVIKIMSIPKKKNNYESIDGDTNNTDNTNKAKNVDNGKA